MWLLTASFFFNCNETVCSETKKKYEAELTWLLAVSYENEISNSDTNDVFTILPETSRHSDIFFLKFDLQKLETALHT